MSVDLKDNMREIAKILDDKNSYPGMQVRQIRTIVETSLADEQVQELAGDLDLQFNSHHTKPDIRNYLSTAEQLVAKGWRKEIK